MYIFYISSLTSCKGSEQTLSMENTPDDLPLYSIAVAAELLGLPPATLRLYERKGLLRPARTEGGTRRYSADDIERMRRVADLQDDGVNLAGIGKVLDLEVENASLRRAMVDSTTDEKAEGKKPEDDGPRPPGSSEKGAIMQRSRCATDTPSGGNQPWAR